ncbi:hydroxymethylglutaryl-CoA synthase [Candidatus Bathyarchaeota archaeon]|jgi:hydroxymethylglutaryl-CoA synthase|nr:hydroxymethylglutaryl-CoA synthase [Candidatus Bathyarchaeota archaeon]
MSHSDVGIVGYGVYVPIQRIRTEVIVKAREAKRKDLPDFLRKVRDGLLLRYKAIAGVDEDTITIASEAAQNAITMAGLDPRRIGSVAVGSESKPYAVGTIARHVASFTGIGNRVYVSDLEGACNAGMQAFSFIEGQVANGKIDYGLAIGADVAQAPQGDPLEYACGAGAGAFVLGKDDLVASIEDTAAYSSLTMDFWRRDGMPYPSHFGRTTVEAYVRHVIGAIEHLLSKHHDLKLMDFDYLTFHQPSGYMPLKVCKTLSQNKIENLEDWEVEPRIHLTPEFVEEKVKPWLRVLDTGNTYAASTPIAVCDILDHATPGQNILAVSYGSGAYTIATWLKVQEGILAKRGRTPTVEQYLTRRREIKLETYQDHLRQKLRNVRRRISHPRIVGEITPTEDRHMTVTLCHGCERVFYPARDRCLEWDCKGPLEQRQVPLLAKLVSFKKLPLQRRLASNFEIISRGKALIVDVAPGEVVNGIPLEVVIRKLDDEGRDGLIIYGPAYRPAFRTAAKTMNNKSESSA